MQANYQILRSSAGFRIGFARLPESECAAVSIHIPAGSRDDPPGQAGLAHFVEHMIFKGTKQVPNFFSGGSYKKVVFYFHIFLQSFL